MTDDDDKDEDLRFGDITNSDDNDDFLESAIDIVIQLTILSIVLFMLYQVVLALLPLL